MEQEDIIAQTRPKNPLFSITPLSKYLALALFILMPFIGGWVGYTYAPERVVEVPVYLNNEDIQEESIKAEFADEPNTQQSTSEAIDTPTLTVTDTDGLFSFKLPLNWRLADTQKHGYIQLFNFPEPVTDRNGWGDKENKIEGGNIMDVLTINKFLSDGGWSNFVAVEIAGKKVFTVKDGIDGNWNWTVVAVPLPNDMQKFVVFTIYGDTSNIGLVIENLLKDFVFLK